MRKWVRGAVVAGLIGVAREDILLHDDVRREPLLRQDQLRINLINSQDPYLMETKNSCYADVPSSIDCIKFKLLESLEGFLSSEHRLGEHALLVKSSRKINKDEAEGRSLSGLAGYLARKAWEFTASTDLVLEFPKELTGGEGLAPRFIDEVFNEFDTIDNQHQKPQIRNQLKKLFIPLLIILKIFKLKLLFLLPLILGVASFKKIIGFLAILIPGVIGYLKLCRSGFDYGTHGHSNYYNRPPHRRHDYEYETDNSSYKPYSPEFANIHPDYLPDYLQESPSNKKTKIDQKYHQKESPQSNNPYYTGTNKISQGFPHYQRQEFTKNSQYQTQREEFWKAQSDYLPYQSYYREYTYKLHK